MKKRSTILITCTLLLLANLEFAMSQNQELARIKRAATGKDSYSQDELVSFKSDVPYKQALEALSALSKKFAKKPIVDPQPPCNNDQCRDSVLLLEGCLGADSPDQQSLVHGDG